MTARAPLGLEARRRRQALVLLLPALALLALVAGWPLLRTVALSFTDAQLADPAAARFVGLDNWAGRYGVLTDPGWWRSVAVTLGFALVSVALETGLGLGVALLLDHPSRLRTLLRAAVLVPWAIPTVVSAKMWAWMLHDQFGVVNHLLAALHVTAAPLAWTADPLLSRCAIVAVDVWKATPFMALLTLAALQAVPRDCLEAAALDGATPWQRFRFVVLPLVRPAIAVAVVFRLLDALRVFDLVYVVSANGRATRSMAVFVREQLVDFGQTGYGSAAATLLFLVVAACAALAWQALAASRRRGGQAA